MHNSKLDAALRAASLGFRVFPVKPNSKHPAIEEWPDLASADAEQVGKWWSANPDFNIGVATGNGVLVVDADTKDGKPGLESLDMLDLSGLPESFRASTPSGGVHVYLKTDRQHGNRANTIPDHPGIDIRAERGYVLFPGSTIDGKPYAAATPHGLAEAPQWFDDLLDMQRANHAMQKTDTPVTDLDLPVHIDRAVHWLENTAPEAVEGAGGDHVTFQVAARLRDFALSTHTALELMLEHWNETKASPPWLPDDLAIKVDNAFRYATGTWGGLTAAADFDALDIDIGTPPGEVLDAVGAATEAHTGNPTTDLNLCRASDFAGLEKPVREFLDEGELVPCRNVTIINGDGATGKSLLAMQLGVGVAGHGRWLGRKVKQGNVMYLSAEDDEDETHIRLKDICAGEGVDLAELNGLQVAVMAGRNCLLAVESEKSASVLKKTRLYQTIRDACAEIRPALLVLDNLADIFGGNENAKAPVRQFVGMLRALAIEFDCAVVLLAHPSLTGMSSGTGSSGNVAWNNSVRSRLYLTRLKDKDGQEADTRARVLTRMKANYTDTGSEIEMRWDAGRFVATAAFDFDDVDGIETETKEARAERIFTEMLSAYLRQKRTVSPAIGANYAPKVFARDRRCGVPESQLEQAMNSMFARGLLQVDEIGPPSRRQKSLVLARGLQTEVVNLQTESGMKEQTVE